MTSPSVLVIGYGNTAHGDDGLGPVFAERLATHALPGLTVQTDFQLSVDHAHDMAQYDIVVFVDAAMVGEGPFSFSPVTDPQPQALGSHTVSPPAALALCTLLFGEKPQTYVLGIRGELFGDIQEGLSSAASRNLDAALDFFAGWCEALDGAPHPVTAS